MKTGNVQFPDKYWWTKIHLFFFSQVLNVGVTPLNVMKYEFTTRERCKQELRKMKMWRLFTDDKHKTYKLAWRDQEIKQAGLREKTEKQQNKGEVQNKETKGVNGRIQQSVKVNEELK